MQLRLRICRSCQLALENIKPQIGPNVKQKSLRRWYAAETQGPSTGTQPTPPTDKTQIPVDDSPSQNPKTALNLLAYDNRLPRRPTATRGRERYDHELRMYSFKQELYPFPWTFEKSIASASALRVFPSLSEPKCSPQPETTEKLTPTKTSTAGPEMYI